MRNERFTRGREARILLVEDDEVVATFLVELLGRLGDSDTPAVGLSGRDPVALPAATAIDVH